MNSWFSEKMAVTAPFPVISLAYPDITCAQSEAREVENRVARESEPVQPAGPSLAEIQEMITRARAEAAAETERRIRQEFEERSRREAEKIKQTIDHFLQDRKQYFAKVEAEIVHLSLAIAAKILHREAQVDPLLVATLVRIAVENMHEGSNVSVRVVPSEAEKWRPLFANTINGSKVTVIEDAELTTGDCILETDIGSANFSIDAQLKEVEQGFFDLLAQRPLSE